MIDKVVRIRAQHGRFGVDHSELFNYEIEQSNKTRDEHMNWLVYKGDAQEKYPHPDDNDISSILKDRLQI
jgi:hypothetical protein